jgi:hypothetical protein
VQYQSIEQAGEDRLPAMLSVIATTTARMARRALGGVERSGTPQIVLAYGGALHNDLYPDDVRRPWSYGPDLWQATSGGYVALDLVVPESIRDSPAWRRLPWYEAYREAVLPAGATILMEPEPSSYVLFFPAGAE